MNRAQVQCMREFILDDQIAQGIKSFRTYPKLCSVTLNYDLRYDLIILDPAWKHKPYFNTKTPYVG